MQRREQLEAYAQPAGLAAGVVLVLAAFLPWVSVHYQTGLLSLDQSVSGFSSWHGKLTVVSGLAIIAASIVWMRISDPEWRQAATGIAIGAGSVALGSCLHLMFLANPAGVGGPTVQTSSSLGVGLYVSLAAAMAATAAGITVARTEPAAGQVTMDPEPAPAEKVATTLEPH